MIRVVQTSLFAPYVKICHGPVFQGAYSYTPYQDSQGGGVLFIKTKTLIKLQRTQLVPYNNSESTCYQVFPSNTSPYLHTSFLEVHCIQTRYISQDIGRGLTPSNP